MKITKKSTALIMLLGLIGLIGIDIQSISAASLTAFEIIQKVDDRDDGDAFISDMIMVKIDKKKQQRKLELRTYSKDYGKDTKSIIFFLSPADKRNVSFLSWDKDKDEDEDDKWLYLPAGNVKTRISGGKKKDPFMGSDFSYADMESIEINDWNYKFVTKYREKDKKSLNPVVAGHDCWIIQATPKKSKLKKVLKEIGYTKRVLWVRKDNFMLVKGRIWVKKGKKTKMFFARKINKLQGIWRSDELEMRTYKGKRLEHRTLLLFTKTDYKVTIDDSMFTEQRMMRGL